jgi:hypothetical protein
MKRIIVMVLSVILALIMAASIATGQESSSGQKSSQSQDSGELAGAWWNWAVSNPSPLEGNYKGGKKCEGEFVEGVFFLAGTTGGEATRTCTVPADTALFFPVVNVVCSEAFNDPTPYEECAGDIIDAALADGEPYATLDGKELKIRRVASGPFTFTLPEDNVFGLAAGSYDAAADGLWVYLPQGLEPGKHTVKFGGDFFGGDFSLNVTYELIVV